MTTVHYRYLHAYLGRRAPERAALLRFPPGVTLEDAGYDWRSGAPGADLPTLPEWAVERLRGLGVEVAASPEAISEAWDRARHEQCHLDLDTLAEDYLDVNARLGGERCVTAEEYAMDTTFRFIEESKLHVVLMDRLFEIGGVRAYGGAAFREMEVPDVLHLRVWDLADNVLSQPISRASCRLHGDMCKRYTDRWVKPGEAIRSFVPRRYLGVRVAMPRQLLDELDFVTVMADAKRFARAALPVARLVLDALPEKAKGDARLVEGLAPLVAITVAKTCEEHAMLVEALRRCRSLREMERCARDPSWAASRALESLR